MEKAAVAQFDGGEVFPGGEDAPLTGLGVLVRPQAQGGHEQAEGVALGARAAVHKHDALFVKVGGARPRRGERGVKLWLQHDAASEMMALRGEVVGQPVRVDDGLGSFGLRIGGLGQQVA